ncbi:ATP-binding protein [Anaerobacillus isosaccharinicus]|uniref:histidine kinase n=1 Tax=Anaerobacillus isosaccharinicus TaxID=1532552 RepID=A0A1S2LHX4_9BACI|nr:HAMP domain-containing sensor histidine kinase [Anaerobacillus isosaccharinicus]MBA5586098.1 HAMP domain-containing protein [Anaerobacillus isosaccharinicus]QOY35633.1 HAMP domain-containing protein [Anaerobacillus isosaccharinicus]
MRFKSSIFTKLFFTYVISSIAAFLIFSAVFYVLFQNDLKQDFLSTLHDHHEQVEQTLKLAYGEGQNKESIISTLGFMNDKDHKSIYLFDEAGDLLHVFSGMAEPLLIEKEFIVQALKGNQVNEFVNEKGQRIFLMVSPIDAGIQSFEEKVLVIALHGFDRVAKSIKGMFLLAGLITTVVTTCFLFLLSKKFSAPLRNMNSVAMEYAKGKFDKKLEVKSKDEIGQLGETLNHMGKELASLDSMRKEFVANVSHDMRSPLTSINGFVGAMIDGTIPERDQKRYLHLMKDETERLIKLVNELLDIARMEAGQVSIHPSNYNVTEQIRTLIAKLEPQLSKQKLEIELQCTDEKDVYVFADKDRIDQVLSNLIQNAINFSPENGLVTVNLLTKEKEVFICIEDHGLGIPNQQLKFIWNRFFKVDKARSQKVGTGIGLSIVKHIIDLHGAKIDVESEVGKGTVFTVTLPLKHEET